MIADPVDLRAWLWVDRRDGGPQLAVTPGPAASLAVSGPGGTIAGSPLSITVEARDACLGNRPSGNLATGYLGTVSFRSSDVNATVAANETFQEKNRPGFSQRASRTLDWSFSKGTP